MVNIFPFRFIHNQLYPFSDPPHHQVSLEFCFNSFDPSPWTGNLPRSLRPSVSKRKQEFVAGRLCAEKALKASGRECNEFLPVEKDGSPQWPVGAVGSITHTHNFASAVVGSTREVRGLGIDTESWINEKRIRKIKAFVATKAEMDRSNPSSLLNPAIVFTLLFSAKESLIKCFSPLVDTSLNLLDFEVYIRDLSSCRFQFRLLRNFSSEFYSSYEGTGWFQLERTRVHTLVHL